MNGARAILGLALGLSVGCTLIVDTDSEGLDAAVTADVGGADTGRPDVFVPECVMDMDCVGDLGVGAVCMGGVCQSDPKWSCVGNVPPPMPGPGTRLWRQRYVELTTQSPPPDLRVKLCQNADIDCSMPIAENLAPASDGIVAASVPNGFEGYAVLTSSVVEDAIIHFPGPIDRDTTDAQLATFQLLPNGFLDTIAGRLMVTLDPARAILIVVSLDCQGRPAAGTEVFTSTEDPQTLTIYIQNDLPAPNLRETSENGNVFLLNHPPGFGTVSIRRFDTREMTGTRALRLEEGFINYLALAPTP